jgi:undecaprenyl-diphosphatase
MITTWFRDIKKNLKRRKSFYLVFWGAILSVLFSLIVFLHYSNPIFDKIIGHWLSARMTESSINTFGIISDLGDLKLIVPLSLCLLVYFLLKRKWKNAAGLLFCVYGGGAVSSLLKYYFQRLKADIFHLNVLNGDFGFPSGHTIMAILFYGYLAYLLIISNPDRRWRWIFAGCAGLLSFIIGLSRLLIGVHLPTDVLGGWVIGLIWLLITIALSEKIGKKSNIDTNKVTG